MDFRGVMAIVFEITLFLTHPVDPTDFCEDIVGNLLDIWLIPYLDNSRVDLVLVVKSQSMRY